MAGELLAADTIATYRLSYAITATGLLVTQHPRREEILTGILGLDRGSTLNLGMRDDPAHPGEPKYYTGLDVWEAADSVSGRADHNLHFLAVWFLGVLATVGHLAKEQDYWDHTPELELLRHLRNGVSHGNRFNLMHGAPRQPAHFGQHVLTREHHGEVVLFEFMSPGDLFALLDRIEAHLRRRADRS